MILRPVSSHTKQILGINITERCVKRWDKNKSAASQAPRIIIYKIRSDKNEKIKLQVKNEFDIFHQGTKEYYKYTR